MQTEFEQLAASWNLELKEGLEPTECPSFAPLVALGRKCQGSILREMQDWVWWPDSYQGPQQWALVIKAIRQKANLRLPPEPDADLNPYEKNKIWTDQLSQIMEEDWAAIHNYLCKVL